MSSDRWSDRAEELRVLIEDIADARARLEAIRMVSLWRETAETLRLEEDICRNVAASGRLVEAKSGRK